MAALPTMQNNIYNLHSKQQLIKHASYGDRAHGDKELERANSLGLKMEFQNNYPLFSFFNIST
jgi:hypothetical protein